MVRGNSASRKSSVAAGLRERFGRDLALVGQDNLRRPYQGAAALHPALTPLSLTAAGRTRCRLVRTGRQVGQIGMAASPDAFAHYSNG